MADLRTRVGGVELACCVYNASGPRTGSVDALAKIGASRAGAVLSKSATLVPQDGNPMPRYKEQDLGPLGVGSINSEGLPNKGIDYYLADEAVATATRSEKPYIVSLSGLSLKDNLEMFGRACKTNGVAAIELNVACPNIPGKPVIAYDFEQLEEVLRAVTSHRAFGKKPLGVKLAPYFDMPHFKRAAEIINKFPVSFVVCINTIGNALIVDVEAEQPLIAPKGGFGGLGGGYVKQTALANVRQMRLHLREDIDVVGAGGVFTGVDAFELILCGAAAVQVGTCHWSEGASCFDRISRELEELMVRKGYRSIEEFRGKLRDFDGKRATKKPRGGTSGTATAATGHSATISATTLLLGVVVLLMSLLIHAHHKLGTF